MMFLINEFTTTSWKVYLPSPPGEIFTRNLLLTLGVSHCAKSEEFFFWLLLFEYRNGKIKKAAKARSEGGGRGGRRKTAVAEERNIKDEMLDFQVQAHPLSL